MKNAILLCAVLLTISLAWLSCAQDDHVVNSTKYFAEEPFSFNVGLQDQTRFRLEGIAGTVEVTGRSDVTSITISGERRVESSSTADAERRLEDLQVEVQDLTNEVLVKTVQPEDTEGANYVVNYTITLPQDLEVKIGNVTGNVAVDSVDNKVSVYCVTGNISLNEINGSAFVVLITGNVSCKMILPPDGVIDLSTVTGNMVLQIPEETSAQLSANVITGTINVSGLTLQDQNISTTSVSGQLGDGNGTILLRVITGTLSISGF